MPGFTRSKQRRSACCGSTVRCSKLGAIPVLCWLPVPLGRVDGGSECGATVMQSNSSVAWSSGSLCTTVARSPTISQVSISAATHCWDRPVSVPVYTVLHSDGRPHERHSCCDSAINYFYCKLDWRAGTHSCGPDEAAQWQLPAGVRRQRRPAV